MSVSIVQKTYSVYYSTNQRSEELPYLSWSSIRRLITSFTWFAVFLPWIDKLSQLELSFFILSNATADRDRARRHCHSSLSSCCQVRSWWYGKKSSKVAFERGGHGLLSDSEIGGSSCWVMVSALIFWSISRADSGSGLRGIKNVFPLGDKFIVKGMCN